ncbi:unnamed protein product [Trifolium pratense]|uniref:Uncharacterized protein n=1 Tax=Trifolium pratense TaxID=57577 RepID=A0ACB0LNP7_TRIPR|nr:unnamed protein product [Trifolium pratense]
MLLQIFAPSTSQSPNEHSNLNFAIFEQFLQLFDHVSPKVDPDCTRNKLHRESWINPTEETCSVVDCTV